MALADDRLARLDAEDFDGWDHEAVTLEVLYFDGCPSHERLRPMLRELARRHEFDLTERRIDSLADAHASRFLGSPSVRVDGVDVEPGAHERTDYGLKCRLYRSATGHSGLPPREWIERALQVTGSR